MNNIRSIIPPAARENRRAPPSVGDEAPELEGLSPQKPTIVAFLRHIGCPFAEKTFRDLRNFASQHGDQYDYIAITHGSRSDTDNYIKELGGAEMIKVVADPEFKLYDKWVVVFRSRLW
jgi:hypothetical protein